MSKKPILTITNHHVSECGNPPSLSTNGQRTLYFENRFGEQWIIQFDPSTGICKLWGGDLGWDDEYRIREFQDYLLVIPKLKTEQSIDEETKGEMYDAIRQVYGDDLTDEECDGLSRKVIMSEEELSVIHAFWELCHSP